MSKIIKYDFQLQEIDQMIGESIEPNLKQLRDEEKYLFEYRNIAAEFGSMEKILTVYKYLNRKTLIENADEIISEYIESIEKLKHENARIQESLDEEREQVELMQQKMNDELGGDLKEYDSKLNSAKKEVEMISTNKKLMQDRLKEETNNLSSLEKEYTKDQQKLAKKTKECELLQTKIDTMKNQNAENENAKIRALNDFELITMGKSKAQDGEKAETLVQQVLSAKDKLSTVESSINRSNLIIEQNQKDLALKKEKVKKDKALSEKSQQIIDSKTEERTQLLKELESLSFDENRFEDLKVQLNQDKIKCRSLTENYNQLQAKLNRSMFSYSKPSNSFDDRNVIGVVCNLFSVNSPVHALALEKACGARLWSVVVQDEQTGKELIENGRLKDRRTFLPLNKVRGKDNDLKVLRRAESLVGKGNVFFAANLVSYDQKLAKIVQYVFGDTLVCPNMDMARKVAFDSYVRKRTVTFDGDVIDPVGTLTGGAIKKDFITLIKIAELNSLKEEITATKLRMEQMEDELSNMSKKSKQYFDTKSKCDLKTRDIESLEQRLKESSHYMLMQEVEDIEALVNQEKENIKKAKEEKKNILNHIKDLENKINNSDQSREKDLAEAKQALTAAEEQCDKLSKSIQKEEQHLLTVNQELHHFTETLNGVQEQIDKVKRNIVQIEEKIKSIEKQLEKATEEMVACEEQYNQYKQLLNTKSNEIKKLQKNMAILTNSLDENNKNIKIKQHEIDQKQTSLKDAKSSYKSILAKNPWIKNEEAYFTSPDSEYKVLQNNFNEQEYVAKMNEMKQRKEKLAKSVNLKATSMFDDKNKECEQLKQKREIIKRDRHQLMTYIANVDKEKETELRKAVDKINGYFGLIFATLLPNSNAKLVLVNEASIQEGLNIKVCLGAVWKESLSELSGGQRSLVALSLILAQLKFNPAPLYILDEVDAALDQSHTQNIGLMIKKHFKAAQVIFLVSRLFFSYQLMFDHFQFIIVSLKDDMFSNANVLFQTKFIDGFSNVDRIQRSN